MIPRATARAPSRAGRLAAGPLVAAIGQVHAASISSIAPRTSATTVGRLVCASAVRVAAHYSTEPAPPPTETTGRSFFRHNLATADWVVFSEGRSGRPNQFKDGEGEAAAAAAAAAKAPASTPAYLDHCPFCRGNEHMTTEDLLRYDASPNAGTATTDEDGADAPKTSLADDELANTCVRVVRNKYPVVRSEYRPPTETEYRHGMDNQDNITAHGYHDVVIESPLHNYQMSTGSLVNVQLILLAMQNRARFMAADDAIRHVTVFKNQGAQAGASLMHPHGQVVGLPIVPEDIHQRVETAVEHYFQHNCQCLYCRVLGMEQEYGDLTALGQEGAGVVDFPSRLVAGNDHFVAYVPWAALSPFNCWILPRRHAPSFLDATTVEIVALAGVLQRVLQQLHTALDNPALNIIVRSAPIVSDPVHNETEVFVEDADEVVSKAFHWHVEVIPRLGAGAMAGFEFGSGMFSNSQLPEDNAATLRAQESWGAAKSRFEGML